MSTKGLFKKSVKLLFLSSFLSWNQAFAAPEGGAVVQGSAEISQTQNQTTINQTSQNTVINWNSFNTASNEAVLFNQPNTSAIALNRITNGLPTQFAGQLNANGQVWVLNPAGVLFTSTAKIDVAGLVATTHSIADQNFMMGNYKFDLVPGSENSKIINDGLISIKDSGIAALVAPYVENNGVIVANLGRVNLSTGASYTLDLYGDNLINFGSNAPIDNGSVSNAGQIIANGGKVYMTANSTAKVVNNVVSMSGVIEATTATTGKHGEIILNGGNSGVTRVSGKLKAPQGHIETSGHVLIIEPTTEIDASGGSWLIDPYDITVTTTNLNNDGPPTFAPNGSGSQIDASLISSQLSGGTNVTLDTGPSGTDAGNITISSGITWNTANTLTLMAANNILINAAVNGGTTGFVALTAGGNITQTAAITANTLTTTSATGTTLTNTSNAVSHFNATNSTSGNISLTNTLALDIQGINQTGANLTITNNQSISQSGAISVAGTSAFTAGVNGAPGTRTIILTNASNNFVGGVSLNTPASSPTASNNVSIFNNGNLILNTSNINGNFTATVSGANSIYLNGSSIASSFSQTYNNPVLLSTNFGLIVGSSTVTFASTVNDTALRAHVLEIHAQSFPNFNGGAPGGITPFQQFSFYLSPPGLTGTFTVDSAFVVGQLNRGTSVFLYTSSFISGGGLAVSSAITQTLNPVSVSLFLSTLGVTAINAPITLMTGNSFYLGSGNGNTVNAAITTGGAQVYGPSIFVGSLSGPTTVNGVTLTGSSTIDFTSIARLNNATINSIGAQTYVGVVLIGGTSALTSSTANINFNSTIDGGFNLNANAATAVNFNGIVGGTPVANLTVTGPTNINTTAITTSGAQLFNSAVTLGANLSATSSAGNITFGSTVNGAFNLTANAFSNLNLNGNVNIASLSATATNVNLSATSITSSGNQAYMVKAGMYVNNTITFNAGTITFDGTSNPSHNTAIFSAVVSTGPTVTKAITINGNTVFNDMSGNGTVEVGGVPTYFFANDWMFNGTTTFMGPVGVVVNAQKTITFVGAVILGTDTSLGIQLDGRIWFQNTVQSSGGPFSLLVSASDPAGFVEFDGQVGVSTSASASNLNNLTVVAGETDFINSGIVDTNGAQYYVGAVKLFTDTLLTSVNAGITFTDTFGRVTLTNTVDSDSAVIANARALTLVSPLTVTLSGNIGSINKLRTLTIGSNVVATPTSISTASISTVASQTYWGTVALTPAAVTLTETTGTSTPIIFKQNVTGASTALTVAGSMTVSPNKSLTLKSINVSGTTIGPTTTTTNGQTWGVLILNSDETFTDTSANGIQYTSTVDGDGGGPWSLVAIENGASAVTFGGVVGTTALSTVTVTATNGINLNGGNITTINNQVYNSAVTLGASAILTSSAGNININSTVAGGGNALSINNFGATSSITGIISNLSSFTKAGAGTLTIPAANTYSGNTIITGGILSINADNNLGTAPGSVTANSIQISNGATLQFTTTPAFTLNANRGITLGSGGGILQVASGVTLTYNGIFSGANALTLNGPGGITLGSNITAPSAITVAANVSPFTFGGTTIASTAGSLTINPVTIFTTGSTINLTATGATSDLTFGGTTLTLANTLNMTAGRNMYLNGNISDVGGTLNLTAAYSGAAVTTPAASSTITSGSFGSPSATGVTAAITVANFNLLQGVWFQLNNPLPAFNISTSFSLSSDRYVTQGAGLTASYMRALSGNGTVGTPYQLTDIYGIQGINASDGSTLLTRFYTLANNIDATGTRTWNSGLGFHPIGYWNTFYTGFVFQGNFNGNGNVINNLYVNRSQTESGIQGEMGSALFAVSGAGAHIHDVGLTNVDIASLNDRAAGIVAFATYQSNTTISNSYVTGKVTGNGGCCIGGVVGYIGAGSISTVYNNATVTSNGGSDVGGVVGYLLGASLTNSYNVGKIYAVGTVSNVGGLVGTSTGNPVITNTYNSGPVNNAFGTVGGLIGFYNTGTITNSYYDTQTSLTSSAFGSGGTSGVTGLTTAQMMVPANFVGWTIADGSGAPASNVFSGATPPPSGSFTWLILTNNTRPMLNMEWSTSIKTPHQVQLMAMAKAANYSLAYNVDFWDGLTSASDVWGTNYNFPSGSGFFPIGGGSAATAFTGFFNGNNLIINNLYINRPTTNFVGLFGANIGTGMTIQNVGLTNVNITGQSVVGGLVGQSGNGNGTFFSGGVVGIWGNSATNITNVYVTGTVRSITGVSGQYNVGGFVGLHTSGTISNSFSTATVSGNGSNAGGVGGFVGQEYAIITNSFATGNVSMLNGTGNNAVAGFAGTSYGGTISQSYSSGNVTSTSGDTYVGGFIGWMGSDASHPVSISNSYSVSNIFASNSIDVGGFAAALLNVTGGTTTVTNSYSSGSVTGAFNTNLGGFIGLRSAGTVNNSFWDTQSSGLSNATGSGVSTGITGQTTAQMQTLATFTGAGWSMTATPSTTATAPAFTWFIIPGNTRPMLMMENNSRVAVPHALQMMSAALGGSYTLIQNIDFTHMFNNVSEVWATNRNISVGTGFYPIGYDVDVSTTRETPQGTEFTGSLNGIGYNINNLYQNNSSGVSTFGVFGAIAGNATIQNVAVINVSITGTPIVGGLIGHMIGSGISLVNSSFVTGSVFALSTSSTYLGIGGFMGQIGPTGPGIATVQNSYSVASVSSAASQVRGGFIGAASGQTGGVANIINSYSTGLVQNGTAGRGFVGFFGTGATITNSFWDIVTSGRTTGYGPSGGVISGLYAGCFAGTGTCSTATVTEATNAGVGITPVNLSIISTYNSGGPTWSISNTATTAAGTIPSTTWFIFQNNTRPMLMSEYNTNVSNTYQMQLVGTSLGNTYYLINNIDFAATLTNTADVWNTNYNTSSGLGFIPVGAGSASTAFQGYFQGNNYVINNLYINRPTTDFVGLFGANIANGATINNVGLTNVNITGRSNVGGLVGQNSNSSANGFIGGTAPGLPGNTYSNISNAYVTGYVNSAGANVGASLTGGFVGFHTFGTISNSYSTATVTNLSNGIYIAGFVGDNLAYITNSFSTGNVIATQAMTGIGGFVGHNLYGTISQSWSGGNIYAANGSNVIGGFAADFNGSPTVGATNIITNSYSTANIYTSNSTNIGGFVGPVGTVSGGAFANITNSYSSGALIGFGNTTVGGFAPSYFASTVTTNNFWDTDSSGIAADPRSGLGVTGRTTVQMQTLATFTGATWSMTGTPSSTSTAPNTIWFIFPGNTRPLLMMENKTTIVNAHQVQMMGATLGGTYQLGGNIDFINGLTSVSDVWATNYNTPVGSGFVPIGSTTIATAFQGNFNGNNYSINNLYINRPTTNFVAMFGTNIGNGTLIQNVGLTNVNITGAFVVGGLIGQNGNAPVFFPLGGPGPIIGNSASNIYNVYTTGTVNSSTNTGNVVGGLIGIHSSGTVSQSFSTATINASSTLTNVAGTSVGGFASAGSIGGLIGTNYANVTQSYASGNVNVLTPGAFIGGLMGFTYNGTVSQSYSSGTVTVANGSKWIGGFTGYEDSYPGGTNTITNSYSVSNIVTSNSSTIGGFAGIISPQSTSPIISNSYSSGTITGTGNTTVGGFLGQNNSGTLTNDFWDTQSSGQASSAGGAGVVGKTTAQMMAASTFSGATWSITNAASTTANPPAFTWFIFEGQTRPMLMMENNPRVASPHAVQMMGAALGGNYTLVQNINFTNMFNNVSEVWATNRNTLTGQGFIPVGNSTNNFTGSLNGNGFVLDNIYINSTISQNIGLFGITNNAQLQKLSVTNAAFTQTGGANGSGVIVGSMNGNSNLSLSYASGTLNNTGNTGGLVGEMLGTSSITDSYNLANVNSTVSGAAGGVVGSMVSGTPSVSRVYDSGAVVGTGLIGGVIGNFASGTLLNNYWDTQTSVTAFGCNSGACANTTGLTTANSLLLASYPGLNITATSSTLSTPPAYTWFIFNNQTRPILMMENNPYVYNAHQLQMMAAALNGNYVQVNAINFTGVTPVDVWASNFDTLTGGGFVPVGTAALPFSGTFNGEYLTVNAMYINSPANTNTGLFGKTYVTSLILDAGVTNANITVNNTTTDGTVAAGILVGLNSGQITNTYVTGSINAGNSNYYTGGLVGNNVIFAGYIANSFSAASVTSGTGANNVGGFVGGNTGMISTSYSTGMVSVGTGSSSIGGLVGLAAGDIRNVYSFSPVVANSSSNLGGLLGSFSSGTLQYAYAAGPIVGTSNTNVGGLIGLLNGGTANNSVWDIGKVGISAGYGSTSSGSVSNVYGGCFGNVLCGTPSNASNATTYDLTLLANYTGTFGWTSGTVISASSATPWNTVNAVSYPYLRPFYTTTPRFVTATSNAGVLTVTNLYQNGSLIDVATTAANGESYFLEGFNNISRVNHTVADNDLIFMDYPSASPASNAIAYAPASGGQMGANNGLTLNTNTVTVGLAGTANTQVYNNTVVNTAKGALSGSAILYSLSGNNLILNSGKSFATTTLSTYTVNGDISTTSGNITMNGPVIISAASPTISTATSGDVNVFNTIAGGGNALTISTVGINSNVTGAISNLTTLTKSGSGTLILTGTNTYTATNITAGTLQIGNGGIAGTLGTGAVVDNGNLSINHSDTVTLSMGISGTGSLTQMGTGTTILTGANTYGTTLISAGTLQVGNGGATGSVGTGAITDNSALIFNLSSNYTPPTIGGTGTVTKNGTGTVTFGVANTYTGITTINNGILSVTHVQGLGTAGGGAITVNNGGTLSLNLGNHVLLNAKPLSLNGAGFGGIGALYEAGVSAGNGSYDTINNLITLTGNTTIGLSSLGDLLINNPGTINGSGFNLTLKGGNTSTFSDIKSTLSLGTGSVTVTGGGYWLLEAANSYSGGSFILNGWLGSFNNPGNAFSTGSITLGDSAGGNNDAALIISNTGTPFVYPNPIILAPNTTGSLYISTYADNAMTTTFTGGVTGNNNLIIYTNHPSIQSASNVFFTTNPVNNSGTVTNGGVNTGAVTFGSVIGSNVTNLIENSSTSMMILTAANTYNTTTITLGTLQVGNAGTTGTLGTGAVTDNGSLIFNRTNSYTVPNTITGTGSLTQLGVGGTTILTANNNYTGGTTITNGTLQAGNNTSTGSLGTGTITDNSALVFNLTSNINVSTAINGTGTVTQHGTGTVTLSAANGYSGATFVNAGVLQVTNNSGLGTTANGTTVTNSTLELTGNLVMSEPLTLTNGTLLFDGGSTIEGGAIVLSSASTNTIQTDGTSTIDQLTGVISGGGNLVKTGANQLNLSNNSNNYTGATTINDGNISILANNALGSTGVGSGTTINGTNSSLTIFGALTVGETIRIDGGLLYSLFSSPVSSTITGPVVLVANSSNRIAVDPSNQLTISGVISGPGGFTKGSPGTLTLTNTNTYAGITDINAGAISIFSDAGLGAAPGSLVVNQLTFSGGSLHTNGTFTMSANRGFTLLSNATLKSLSGVVSYTAPVDGSFALVLDGPGGMNMGSTVGGVSPLTSLTANANISLFTLSSPNIITTGNQLFSPAVVLGGDVILTSTGAGITFSNTVDSNNTARSLTLDAFLPVTLTGNIGTGLGGVLSTLHIINQTNINTAFIHTVDAQLYDGVVLLGNNTKLTVDNGISGQIIFDGTVSGAFDLVIDPPAIVQFNSDVNVASLNVEATTAIEINTANIVTTVGSQIYNGPVIVNLSATLTSADDIDFQNTVDGPANLILNPTGTAIFQDDVGATTPLASLTVNGLLDISGATVINTDNNQFYSGLVTLNNNLVMTAGASGCSTTNCVQFSLGNGITGPAFNLEIYTFDASKGPSGAGIAGTVNVNAFTMGGTGGGDISPISQDSFVGGAGTTGAWDNTFIAPGATGLYCVNGNCTGALTITATDTNKTYGSPFTPTLFSVIGASGGDVISITLTSPAGSPVTATVLGGPYSIIPSNASSQGITNNHYTSINYGNGSLTVDPAALTVKADDVTKTYGQTTTFTGTEFAITSGTLFNTDNITSVTLASPGAAPTANVAGSPYAITISNAVGSGLSNYTITYDNSGAINVNPAALTITPNNITKTYGTTTPPTTSGFVLSGIQNGETIGTIDISSAGLAPTASVLGGPYAITGSNASGGTFDPNNYAINYVSGSTITVNPAPLDITPDSITKTYGQTTPGTTSGFTVNPFTPLQNGETIGTIDISSAGLAPTASVLGGPYAIVGSNASGGTFDPNNYAINYVSGATITVNPAPLDITPDSIVKMYGTTTPGATSGFTINPFTPLQNGETIGTIDISSAGLAPTASVLGGPYAITGSNASGGTFDPNNYAINYVSGSTITVNPAPLDITPDSITKTYGQTTPGTTSGFTVNPFTPLQNGETIGTIDISSAGLAPTASVLGGPYAITGSNASGGTFDPNNYSINYLSGANITVNPAVLTITSLPQTKVEGDFLPLTTTAFSPSGLQNGETVGTVDADSLGLSPSAAPGIYPYISVSNAAGGTFDPTNYIINYVFSGDVTVLSGDAPINTFNIPPVEIFSVPTNVICDEEGCHNLIIMIDNLVEVGVMTCGASGGCGFGFAQAEDTNGVVRILMPGDVVYAGDKILKDANSCACVKSLYTNNKTCMGPKNLGLIYK